MAQSAEIKLNGNKWEAAHCNGPARLGTDPFGRYRNSSEYWTEQTVPKVRSVRKANNSFEVKSFMRFFSEGI
jgi:hypothetical protein